MWKDLKTSLLDLGWVLLWVFNFSVALYFSPWLVLVMFLLWAGDTMPSKRPAPPPVKYRLWTRS